MRKAINSVMGLSTGIFIRLQYGDDRDHIIYIKTADGINLIILQETNIMVYKTNYD